MTGFIIGFFIGGIIGVLITGLCVASKLGNDYEDI